MTKEEKKAYRKIKRKEYYEKNKEAIKAKIKTYKNTKKGREIHRAAIKRYAKTEKGKKVIKKTKEQRLKKLNLVNEKISRRTLYAWGLQVKERDKNMCQICYSTDNLHAHHILSKSKHPTLALLLNNGITLCETCHIEEHRLNGEL